MEPSGLLTWSVTGGAHAPGGVVPVMTVYPHGHAHTVDTPVHTGTKLGCAHGHDDAPAAAAPPHALHDVALSLPL